MATTTLATPNRQRSSIFLRFLLAFGTVLVLALVAVALLIYSIGRSELPQVDGTLAVAGLSAPVSVVRDKLGVPHIRAASYDDLLFAQGFVTAQDRLWEMDISRRYAAGTLAEILGPKLLRHERQQRYLQIPDACERAASKLEPQQRHYLEMYARGVNALIERSREHLPLEFRILRYSPAPWRAEDSLLIGANMNQMLNTQYDLELRREKVIHHLNPQELTDLYPTTSWRDLPPARQANVSADEEPAAKPKAPGSDDEDEGGSTPNHKSALLDMFAPSRCDMCVAGSNN